MWFATFFPLMHSRDTPDTNCKPRSTNGCLLIQVWVCVFLCTERQIQQCSSLELAMHSISTCTKVLLYCKPGFWNVNIIAIRIPSPLPPGYTMKMQPIVSVVISNCGQLILTESQKEYCRLPSRNESKHCTASPSAGKWSSPPTTGPRPPPCSGFTFTAVNQRLAVMFGGWHPERGAINDVYIIDFSTMVRWECTCNNVYTVYKL